MKLDSDASFINFVYPFLCERPEAFRDRATAIDRAEWQGRYRPFKVWDTSPVPKDDLLAHFILYLNPDPPAGTPPTARHWEIASTAWQSPLGLGGNAKWTLRLPHTQVPLSLAGIQLTLFGVGVGFLSVAARAASDTVDDWLNLLHYFRFVRGQRDVRLGALRSKGQEEVGSFFPEPAGGLTAHPDGTGELGDVLDAVLKT